jgi:3D-(3,5/4)-trihydroxycyclohexane-1,2-dione acylhydrolase (decyclizing)
MTGGAHLRRGTAADGRFALAITPESAGWGFSGLRILELEAGGSQSVATGENELIVLALNGLCTVDVEGESFEVSGRADVFSGMSDFVYAPRDAHVRIASADGGRFALPAARAQRRLSARHVPASDVPVELRGAGSASRQVNNFCAPDAFVADRLIAVEVLTPGGNWSSYPPHKHDEDRPGVETVLEEIYYYEVARGGFGYQRVSRDRHHRRGALRRCDRDAVRVPRAVDGRARLRPLLPERHGWPGGARVALHRRRRACPDSRVVGRAGARRAPAPHTYREANMKLTLAQALVRFLAVQEVERDGVRAPFFAGCLGIFGHGNLAGIGQALQQEQDRFRYLPARNEQAMVHGAVAFARQRNRLATWACTSSIGPGATNMVTGAALATINRLPVLLLPGDMFATRAPRPVLQQLEAPHDGTLSVNDAFRPVSRYFDRIERLEQLMGAALAAMRVLTDPAETGAVTLALPEDVQTEAFEVPDSFLEPRVWTVERRPPAPRALARAVDAIRGAKRPLIVAGGGVIYSEATGAMRAFAEATGIPVCETQAGRGALVSDHPLSLGAVGATGTTAANRLAREADLVSGIGTRYSDFTTASKSAFQDPEIRFVNINVASLDAVKHSAMAVEADAREALDTLRGALAGHRAPGLWTARGTEEAAAFAKEVSRITTPVEGELPNQVAVIAAVNDAAGETDVVVCAAGSMPGDLHKLWRARDPDAKGYHVEYGYSCMGYEIPGGMGVKLAAPDRDVYGMVGDGSFLMLPGELATAAGERIPLTIVLVDNHGYASIGALSRSVGSAGFGTHYRRANGSPPVDSPDGTALAGEFPVGPTDLATAAEGLGARVI